MTNFFAQTAPAAAARCYSTSRRAPSRRSLCRLLYAAHQEAPVDRLPKNRCSSDQLGTFLVYYPTAFGNWRRYDHQVHRQPLVASADTRRSTASIYWLFSRQMTITHPILKSLLQPPLVTSPPRFRSTAAGFRLFFQPRTDGIAGNPEGARQSAQGRAFFVRPQDFLALLWTIAQGLRMVTTAALTIFAVIALFAIASFAIAKQIVTATMTTGNRNSNHPIRVPFLTPLSHYPINMVMP